MELEQPQPKSENPQTERLTKKQRKVLKKLEKREQVQQVERNRKAKIWAAWIATVVAIVFGLWWLVASSNSQSKAAVPPSSEIVARDWRRGGEQALAQIIEYSDFQCPACGTYFPIIQELTEEFGDSVRFAYRHFPLRAIHPNAEAAARAAEAAGAQGAFWGMHDALFERQSEWSGARNPFDSFAGYAALLGLDAARFEADYNSDAVKDAVRAHETAGRRLGVAGTPTFVVNGERIENPKSPEEFRALLVSIVGEPKAPKDEDTATTTDEGI